MADRMGVSSEEYSILQSMDEDVIEDLYADSKLTFEVFFNYEGISESGGFYQIGEQKQKDLDFFISQYQREAAAR